jgi:iron(III) transport system ATP-binding protein
MFQDYALFPHLNVAQNIGFGLKKLSAEAREQQVQALLKLVDLEPYAKRFPHELSGGQHWHVPWHLNPISCYSTSLFLISMRTHVNA